jgi:hypothetical protein
LEVTDPDGDVQREVDPEVHEQDDEELEVPELEDGEGVLDASEDEDLDDAEDEGKRRRGRPREGVGLSSLSVELRSSDRSGMVPGSICSSPSMIRLTSSP